MLFRYTSLAYDQASSAVPDPVSVTFHSLFDSTQDTKRNFWNTWDNLIVGSLVCAASAFLGSFFMFTRRRQSEALDYEALEWAIGALADWATWALVLVMGVMAAIYFVWFKL